MAQVSAHSNGNQIQGCVDGPQSPHNTAWATTPNPFHIVLPATYIPNTNYSFVLGNSTSVFKGFILNSGGILSSTDRNVIPMSSCPNGLTHKNSNSKTTIAGVWTSPVQGTGSVVFQAVIVTAQGNPVYHSTAIVNESTSSNTGTSGPTFSNTGTSGPTSSTTGTSGPTSSNTGTMEPTSSTTGTYGPTFSNTGTSGPTRNISAVLNPPTFVETMPITGIVLGAVALGLAVAVIVGVGVWATYKKKSSHPLTKYVVNPIHDERFEIRQVMNDTEIRTKTSFQPMRSFR